MLKWLGGIVLVGCPTVYNTAGTRHHPESGVLRIVRILRLFFSIQVIEVSKEFVKPVDGR